MVCLKKQVCFVAVQVLVIVAVEVLVIVAVQVYLSLCSSYTGVYFYVL
jgi:hypothetical protein